MDVRDDFLSVSVTVRIPPDGLSVNELEAMCVAAGRELFTESVRQMQAAFQARARERLERRDWRRRWLTTRLGPVALPLLKVRDRATRRSTLLGLDLLDLAPRQAASAWVEQRAVELRVRGLSYRQAAAALRELDVGGPSAMWLWRRVQARGRQWQAGEAARAQAVAIDPLAPLTQPPAQLFLEADEIHVAAQRSATDSHRIKVGLSYTGRERVRGYRRPRYRLRDKRLYGGIADFDHFGDGWRATLEWQHAVSAAPAVLYLSDGDPGLVALRARCFPHAIGQLDWRHVFADVAAAAPDEICTQRWIAQLSAGRLDLAVPELRRQGGRGEGSAAARDKVLRRLDTQAADFYGWRRFRRQHDPDHRLRLPRGTGGIEKNQEITIGRAMKRRGMAWTAPGAHHLAKLVLAYQDQTQWNSLWQEPFPP